MSGERSDGASAVSGWLSDPRVTIARRDLASLSREKTIVLALLIQLFVAAFSSFLVVGLTSLYSPGSVGGADIVVGVSGPHEDALVDAANRQDGIRVVTFADAEEARTAYQRGGVHALMLTASAERRIAVRVVAPTDSIRTTLIVNEIRSLLEQVERTERRERASSLSRPPLTVPEDVEASQYFGFTYTVLIPLLLFLPPFISGSVAVDALTEEMERGTLELLRVAPVSLVDIVDGKAIGMILIAPLQALMWLGLLGLNGITVANVLPLVAVVAAFATVLVVLGLALGVETGQRRQAQLLYSVVAIFAFGTLVLLPEHPATTVAKLAVDSATLGTYLHVLGYVVAAAIAFVGIRRLVARADAESLS